MDVIFLPDVLLIDHVGKHSLGRVSSLQQVHEAGLEVMAKVCQELVGLIGKQQQLPLMRLAHRVTLETILVSAKMKNRFYQSDDNPNF